MPFVIGCWKISHEIFNAKNSNNADRLFRNANAWANSLWEKKIGLSGI